MPRSIIDSVQGTLEFLILKALTWDEMHGYAIVRWIFDHSREELQIDEGTMYPALHRMELKGLLASEWGISDTNRRAKFYRLTSAGRRELAHRLKDWERFTRAVERIGVAKKGGAR